MRQRRLVMATVAAIISCGVSASAQHPTKPDVRQRVESLGNGLGRDAFRIFPIDKPIWDEEWAKLAPTPNDIRRFVFVARGRGLSFYVTFVLDGSDRHAQAMWERSSALVQMAGRISKEFGADELESWPSHVTGRWGHTLATVSTDGTAATPEEWNSVMRIVDCALLDK
jgi:hypothetical protein